MNRPALLSIVLSLLSFSIADNAYFPVQAKHGGEGVTAFEAKWYGQVLERMNEPSLYGVAEDPDAEIYRVMILPTWGNAISVRVQKRGMRYSLSSRRLDGQAGYDSGKLVESKDVELDADDSLSLAALIATVNFLQLPSEESLRGFDGEQIVLEGVARGRYHVVSRWCPTLYGPQKRGLVAFNRLCKFLCDRSTLSQRPTNRGRKIL